MVDNRGYRAIVNAVERLKDAVQIESNANLIVTRSIRENLKEQFSVINRIDRRFSALTKFLDTSPKQTRAKASSFEIDGTKIGKEIAKELRAKPLQVEVKQSFFGSISKGLKEGLGIGLSNQFVKGFDKSLKSKTGFNVQSLGFGSLTAVTNPRQALKDASQTRRQFQLNKSKDLPAEKLIERDILLDEEIERYRQEIVELKKTIKNSEKLTQKKASAKKAHETNISQIKKAYKEYDIDIKDPDKPIVVVVGGFTGTGGTSSRAVRSGLGKVLGSDYAQIEEVFNPATDPDKKTFSKNLPEFIKEDADLAPLQEAIEEGYYRGAITIKQFHNWINHNADAVKVAAKVLSAKRKNPNAQIDLLGFSGGGYTVEEALAILQQMGITDVKGIGAGTPNLGIPYKKNPNYKRVLGTTDRFVESPLAQLMEPEKTKQATTRNVPGFSNTTDHGFFDYIFNPEVIKGFSQNVGTRIIEKKVQDKIGSLRKKIAKSTEQGKSEEEIANKINADINKIQDYLNNFQDYLGENFEKIAENLESFKNIEKLEKEFSIDLPEQEVSQGIQEIEVDKTLVEKIGDQISETIEKILEDSFKKALEKLAKQTGKTQSLKLSDKYLIFLNNQIKQAQKSANQKISGIIPNYKDLTTQEKKQRGREFSADIQQQVKGFRKAIRDQDKKLARELGEKILKDIQSVKKVYSNLIQELPSGDSGVRSIRALSGNLTRIEGEVLQGAKGKGRSQVGLVQLVREAELAGDDASKGFVEGIEQSLSEVENAGEEFSETFLQSVKDTLGIASPSVEMFNLALDVVAGFEEGVNELGERPSQQIKEFISESDRNLSSWVDKLADNFNRVKENIANKFPILRKFTKLLATVAVGFIAFDLATTAIRFLIQMGDAAFDAVLGFESLELAMLTLTGSSEKAKSGLAFVADEADRLGLSLKVAEEAYTQLTATTRYSGLRGKGTDQLFSIFSETFSLRGLSQQQQEAAFRAINQALSKGKLGAEERTQQLGEIPALAFEQVTARALGINTRDLQKLTLDTTEVLPKIAAQYAAENAAITESTETTQSAINRYKNSILLLQRSMSDWVKGGTVFFNTMAKGITMLAGIMPNLVDVIVLLASALAFDQAYSLVKAFLSSKLAANLFQKALTGLVSTVLPALLAFAKKLVIFTSVVEGISLAIEVQKNAYQTLTKDIESATKQYEKLAYAVNQATKSQEENQRKLPKSRRNVTLDETFSPFGIKTPFNLEPIRQGLSFLTGGRLITRGQARVQDLAINAERRSDIIAQTLSQQNVVFEQVEAIKEIDQQLRLITSRRASLGFNQNERYEELLKQESELIEQRDKLISVTSLFSSSLESDQNIIKRYLEELDKLAAEGNITGKDEASLRKELELRLEAIEETQEQYNSLTRSLEINVNSLEKALRNLNEQAVYFNETLERATVNARTNFLERALGSNLGSSVVGLGQGELEQRSLETRRNFLVGQLEEINILLSDRQFLTTLEELRNQARTQGVNLDNTATIDRFLEQNRSQQETAVLNALRQQLELQGQLGQTEEQLANSILNQRNALFDLNRTINDYFVNLFQQINEARIETERLIYNLRNNQLKTELQRAIVPGSQTFINNLVSQIQSLFDESFGLAEKYFGTQSGKLQFFGEEYSLNSQLIDFTRNVAGATEAIIAFTEALNGRIQGRPSQQQSQRSDKQEQAVKGVVGYVGSTGRSTGSHLDIRGFTASDRKQRISRERLTELLQYFEVGGKPLKSFPLTSGYGQRTHPITGKPSFHPAFDFGIPMGTPIRYKGEAVRVKQRPNLGAAGNTVEIILPTGEIIQLLHLSKFGDAVAKVVKDAAPKARVQPSGQASPYQPFFDILFKGEGDPNSINRGRAEDTPGGFKAVFGRNADQVTIGEILEAQKAGKAFAVGFPQFIPTTLKGAVSRTGLPLDTPFNRKTQETLAIDLINKKRPNIGRYLRGESNDLREAAQDAAREWAAIGLTYSEAGRGIGQSRYAGTAGNAASISPQEVQRALQQVRANLTNQDPVIAQATQGTQQLIDQKAANLNLQDAALNQDIQRFLLNLEQTRETIQRQLDDGLRNTTNQVSTISNQLEDFRSRYSGQTLSSQAQAELRGLETEYRNFDNQLFEQERLLQDNIRGIQQFIERSQQAQSVLRESGSPLDSAQADFLEGLTPRLQEELTIYENYRQRIEQIRKELQAAKIDAQNFVKEQARLRAIEKELTTLSNEQQNAQNSYNFALEKTIALSQSNLQLERDRLRIRQEFADDPQELQRQLAIAKEQATLREREINLRIEEQQITRSLSEVNRELTIAQQQASLKKVEELQLLQSELQLQQEILQIRKQYPDLAQQELEIEKARESARLRELQIEKNIQGVRLQREREDRSLDSQIAENRARLSSSPFESARIRQDNAIANENLRYREQIQQLESDTTLPAQQREERLTKALEIHRQNLSLIDRQYQSLGETITGTTVNAIGNFVNAIANGQDAFQSFTSSVLQGLSQIGQSLIMNSIRGLLGLPSLGFAGSFADGGTVGEAMRQEGANAALAVFTPGEEILSLKTGEAQRYQELKKFFGKNPLEKINFYKNGGTIEGTLLNNMSNTLPMVTVNNDNYSSNSNSNRNTNININVSSPNASSFRKSERQLGRMLREYSDR